MNALLKYFINNAVATNLIMLAILGLGLVTLNSARIEAFPKVPASTITISTLYLGASAEQIDELISQKIEHKIEGISGIKKVYTSSLADASTIVVEKNFNADIHRLKEKIRNKIDEIYDFPSKMQRPVFTIDDFSMTAMYITLSGKSDTKTLEYFGHKVQKQLLQLPEISRIDTWGDKQSKILIEFKPSVLQRYNMTLDEIITILQTTMDKKVDGKIKKDGKIVSLEVNKDTSNIHQLRELILFVTPSQKTVRLGDIANVKNSFEDDYIVPKFDDEIAYGMEVKIANDENVIDIANILKENIKNINATLPSNLTLHYWGDSSEYISNRLSLLGSNALQGIMIVFVLLALFLNIKLAFWVAMGIPISLAGSIAILGTPWLDYSINDITTLGMILSLGLLVDDAIVIGESIFTERKKTKDVKVASIKGVHRVATATIFGALTTVAAFIPMFLIQDELIKVLTSFSIVIIVTLLVSLFESKFLLPAHITHISQNPKDGNWLVRRWDIIQNYAKNTLRYVNYKLYAPTLKQAIKHRYAVVVAILSLGVLGLGLLFNGTVKTIFYPEVLQQSIQIKIDMDKQANATLTNQHVKHISKSIKNLNASLVNDYALKINPIKHTFMQIEPSHVEIYIELSASDTRKKAGTMLILDKLKNDIGTLEACEELQYSATDSFAGKFEINVYAEDEATLKKASKELQSHMSAIKGVSQVSNSLKTTIPKLQIHLKPIAYKLGFDEDIFSKQMSQYFSDTQVSTVTHQNRETKIVVKQYDIYRDSIYDVLNTKVRNKEGKWFSLTSVANIQTSTSFTIIEKKNRKRVATISASLDKNVISSEQLQEKLSSSVMMDIKQRYPTVEFDEAGELESIGVAKKSLTKTLLITMLLIYILLALPLKSYVQPFIIMSIIPFGFIGSMFGHLIEGFTFSIFSFLGILALIGIVVNDSLVMMTQYNQKKSENISTKLALRSAGVGRFRAIFLTTVTTVLGLMPLINETSENAQYLIPSAISIAYGEIFATILTLILIPVLIAISEDVKMIFQSKKINKLNQKENYENKV